MMLRHAEWADAPMWSTMQFSCCDAPSRSVPATGNSRRILRVVIEAKGWWNKEVSHALETQLAERYLKPMPDAAGLFLVAWFDPRHGAREGSWKNDAIRGDRRALLADLTARAGVVAEQSGRAVRAVVIDCSMPAKADPAITAV